MTLPAGNALTTDDTYQDSPLKGSAGRGLILKLTVATAATTVTIKAGNNPPALAAGLGDLVFTSLATGSYLVLLESGRFVQSNGNIQVKAATAANVTVAALQIPRGAA
ncbi:MAG: hypothetical protein ACRDRO_27805 [Pseudonocardiaceae bacterium]